jgi:hypothetical protein
VVVSGSCKETCAFLVTPNDLEGRGVGVLLCWPVDNCVWWLVHCLTGYISDEEESADQLISGKVPIEFYS